MGVSKGVTAEVIGTTGLQVSYIAGKPAVNGIDIRVEPGEVVALLGANGAGKTSTILALSGALRPARGVVSLDGSPTQAPLHRMARMGVGLLTEERAIFPSLTVLENLRLGRGSVEAALQAFPELREHKGRRAGLLSGGQQQMLALARILAARPRVLLADELSLGLAPVIVTRLLQAVRQAADSGVAVLLVEQHIHLALQIADRAYVMRRGDIVHEGPAADLRDDTEQITRMYLEGDS